MKLPEAIYCKTKEESRRIREIMHEQGLTWYGGKPYMAKSHPSIPTSEIIFYPSEGEWNHAIDHEGCRTTPAAEVISQYTKQDWQPKNGDMILVSDDRKTYHGPYRYTGVNSEGDYVVEVARRCYEPYQYIKKAPEGLREVKTLMEKYKLTKYDL